MQESNIVYLNALTMIKYRGGTCTDYGVKTATEALPFQEFAKIMKTRGYVVVEGRAEAPLHGDYIVRIYVFGHDNKHTTTTDAMRKIVEPLGNIDTNTDVLFVSPNPIATHPMKVVDGFVSSHVRLLCFTYSLLAEVIPECSAVPEHKLLTEGEIERLSERYIDRGTMRHIYEQDPPVAWLGGRPGDVVEVARMSASVGIAYEYYVCVRE